MTSGCILGALSVQASLNLVADPGFEGGETGTLTSATTPWYNANPLSSGDIIDTSNPNSGAFNAVLTSTAAASTVLAQNLILSTGTKYSISFFAQGPGAAGSLAVSLNGTAAGTIAFSGGGSTYAQYVFTAMPATSSGLLSLIWSTASESPTSLDIDDVSVTPVPEPTTMIAGALMLLPFAASTLKLRKKASV